MNVLMISADRWFLEQESISDVRKRHREYGKSVDTLDIVVQSTKKGERYALSDNVTVYPTNSKTSLAYVLDTSRIAQSTLKDKKYDLIITQDPFLTGLSGLKLQKQFKAKLLVDLHGDVIDNPAFLKERIINRILVLVADRVLQNADAVRVMSGGQKKKVEKRYPGKPVEVISTPVNLNAFSTQNTDREKEWETIITMVGRKDPAKDFPTLFKAMRIVFEKRPEVGLYLIGNYADYADVPFPRNRIRLFGKVAGRALPELYKASDIVVLTSTSESFGKVLVEANATGLPVVSTDTTGAREIIQDGYNGYIVPKGDYKACAKRLIELAGNKELREKMGLQGKHRVKEKYGDNTKKIIDFWHAIASDTI